MLDTEFFVVAFNNLKRQKMRSYLTLLGIVIGIAAIVALISIGQGLSNAVTDQLSQLGMNTIYIEPGSEGNMATTVIARTIKERDLEIVERIPGVKEVVGFYEGAETMKRNGESVGVLGIGIDPDKMHVMEDIGYIEVINGRNLKSNDRYAVIIYENFAASAFSEELHLRERVEIGEKSFRIVGISKESSFSVGGIAANMIMITDEVAKELFGVKSLTEVSVEVVDRDKVAEVSEKIEFELEKEHGDKDFYLITAENISMGAGAILGLIQLILVGIASISLLVGGIGIMNTMLMSVLERTREIGLMKAIGATNRHVLLLFLLEAGFIGMVGGIIGITIGYLISVLVSVAAAFGGFALNTAVGPELIIGALAFSMIVGMLSGIIPARRAAKLDPVEALRYE